MARGKAIVFVSGIGAVVILSAVAMIARSAASPSSLGIGILFALAISAIAARLDIAAMVRTLETLRVIVPILAFSVAGAAIGARPGTIQFDEVGAQLIVVLLLALAVEARFFRVSGDEERLDALASFFVMTLLAVGEFYALSGLLSGEPRHAEMIAGAIAAGFAAVAVSAMLGPAKRQAEGD